jgi:hypothetical protein
MNYLNDLGQAARALVLGLFNREAWSDITMGLLLVLIAALYILFRVLVLVLFPITVPLLAWARRTHPYQPKGAGE